MENNNKEPKFYNDGRRLAMQRYRKKRSTIQSTLTYKTWKKALIDEQAAKRGVNLNRYFLGMMEKDAKGQVYIVPDMSKEEAIRQVKTLAAAGTILNEDADSVLQAMDPENRKALLTLSREAGIDEKHIIRALLTYISVEMTYIGAETILASLEEFGADRNNIIAAIRLSGMTPAQPVQCTHSSIQEPGEDDE